MYQYNRKGPKRGVALYSYSAEFGLEKTLEDCFEDVHDICLLYTSLDFMSPKLPGLGDVDWGKYVSALTDIGFDGYTCIEVEDKAFEGSKEKVEDSLVLSQRYLKQYVI